MTILFFFYMLFNTVVSGFVCAGALHYIKRDGADTRDWVALAALAAYTFVSAYFTIKAVRFVIA